MKYTFIIFGTIFLLSGIFSAIETAHGGSLVGLILTLGFGAVFYNMIFQAISKEIINETAEIESRQR